MAQEHAGQARGQLSGHHGRNHDRAVFLRADRAHDQDDTGTDEDVEESREMTERQGRVSRLHHDQDAGKADQDGDPAGEPVRSPKSHAAATVTTSGEPKVMA